MIKVGDIAITKISGDETVEKISRIGRVEKISEDPKFERQIFVRFDQSHANWFDHNGNAFTPNNSVEFVSHE